MRYNVTLLTVLLLVLCLSSVQAGSSGKIGTAGAQELRIPVGSRGTAMGGAVVANTAGLESIFWNPAGVASIEGTSAMFTHLPYIADINVNFGAMGTTIEGFGSLAASLKIVSIGEIEQTTVSAPEGNGTIFDPTFSVLGLTYARQLTANTSFGITAQMINESVMQVSASGFALDFGVLYDPRWNGVKMGVSIKNLGPNMHFTGEGFKFPADQDFSRLVASENAAFELPTNINIGLSYDAVNQEANLLQLAGNFRSNNFSEDQWQFGAEYSYDSKYFLRLGYDVSNQDNYLYGFSAGAGLDYELSEGTTLSLAYSWVQTEFFDNNQFFTLGISF